MTLLPRLAAGRDRNRQCIPVLASLLAHAGAFLALIMLKSAPLSPVVFQTIEVSLVEDEARIPAPSTPTTPRFDGASSDQQNPIPGRATGQVLAAPTGRWTVSDWSPRFKLGKVSVVANIHMFAAALECLAFQSGGAAPSRPGRQTCALNGFEFARGAASPRFAPPPGTHFSEPEAAVDYRVLLAPLKPDLSPFRDNPLPDQIPPGIKALESSLQPDQILR
jgi:hypothetical protein